MASVVEEVEVDAAELKKQEARWLFRWILFTEVAVYMEAGAVPALLHELAHWFEMSYSQQGFLGGIVYLMISLGCPLATVCFQRYSPKWVLVIALFLNCGAVILFGCTPSGYAASYYLLLGARALIGFTQAFLCVYMAVWIDHFAPADKFTTWFSYNQASVPGGIVLGYLAGTVMVQIDLANGTSDGSGCGYFTCWRYPFLLQASLILPVCIRLLFVREPYMECIHQVGRPETDMPLDASPNSSVPLVEQHITLPPPQHPLPEEEWLIEEGDEAGGSLRQRCWWNCKERCADVTEVLSQPLFIMVMLLLSSIYFVATGIQYWVTDYLISVLHGPKAIVMILVVVCSATAPIAGVVFGGWFIDRYCGGCRGHGPRLKALGVVTVFGLLANIFSYPATFVTDEIYVPCMCVWLLLFFGASSLPALTGIYIDIVPPYAKATGSSLAQLLTNIMGFAAAPVVSGWLMDFFQGNFASCKGTAAGKCPEAFLWGFRIILLTTCGAVLLALLIFLYAYWEWHQATLHGEAIAPQPDELGEQGDWSPRSRSQSTTAQAHIRFPYLQSQTETLGTRPRSSTMAAVTTYGTTRMYSPVVQVAPDGCTVMDVLSPRSRPRSRGAARTRHGRGASDPTISPQTRRSYGSIPSSPVEGPLISQGDDPLAKSSPVIMKTVQ